MIRLVLIIGLSFLIVNCSHDLSIATPTTDTGEDTGSVHDTQSTTDNTDSQSAPDTDSGTGEDTGSQSESGQTDTEEETDTGTDTESQTSDDTDTGSDTESDTEFSHDCVVYVKESSSGDGSSWESALGSLQSGIWAAHVEVRDNGAEYCEVWVHAGTYTSPQSGFEIQQSVYLFGGFGGADPSWETRDHGVNTTTLNGNGSSDHVITCSGHADAVLDGFTVTGGSAVGTGAGGGGMYNDNCSPRVTNCRFYSNWAQSFGGGMYNLGGSSPTVTNCVFEDNTAEDSGGGMHNAAGSNPQIFETLFISNTAISTQHGEGFGGGIYNAGNSSPILEECIFESNETFTSGGGIYNSSGTLTLTSCTIFSNYVRGGSGGGVYNVSGTVNMSRTLVDSNDSWESNMSQGAGMYNLGTGNITNCIFVGNTVRSDGAGAEGGGLFSGGTTTVTNTTIYGNSASSANPAGALGAGIYRDAGTTVVKNAIVRQNLPSGLEGAATVTYSNLQVDTNPDYFNINEPSGFVAAGTGDFHLAIGSACIDKGTSQDAPGIDFDGYTRPYGNGWDMGAYEYHQ